MRAQNSGFGDFPTQCMLQTGDGCVACLKLLVGLHRQLRNLARTGQLRAAAPVAVAAQRIHIGQNPARHHKVRLLARLAQQVQADRHIVELQADQQLFCEVNMLGIGSRIPLSGYGLNK